MKEERRVAFSIGESQELPFVNPAKITSPYARKNKNHSNPPASSNEADRIRARYMKLCNQAKQSFSSVSNKQSDGALKQHARIAMREGKGAMFCRVPSMRKQFTHESEEVPQQINPFAMALEQLQVHGRKSKKEQAPGFSPVFRGKKLKPIANFLIKRMETDYLNIGRAKLEIKSKPQKISCNKDAIQIASKSSLSYYHDEPEKLEEFPHTNNKMIRSITESKQDQKPLSQKMSTISPKISKQIVRKPKSFTVPFDTYYYRDLLWKVAYSNNLLLIPPLEYEHRLKVYIGKGNNGGLIRGLVKRRIWFAITDRLQDANFVWTQLKVLSFFDLQQKREVQSGTIQNDKILNQGLLTECQANEMKQYFQINHKIEQRQDEKLQNRFKYFIQNKKKEEVSEEEDTKKKSGLKILKTPQAIRSQRLQNHFKNNYIIGNKKTLFQTMSLYYKAHNDYVFNYLPYTYHVQNGVQDEQFLRFLRFYYQRGKDIRTETPKSEKQEQNAWIIKPGENSNRGMGIRVCKTLEQIKTIVKQKEKNTDGSDRTFIIQMYLEKPLLYQKRKFDLRHYMMVTCVNGVLKGYWYRDGYVRTTSSEYSMNTKEGRVHLTNDAIQKNLPDYGKYEKGNKLSYDELHSYLSRHYGYKNYFFKDIILPKMKKIGTDVMRASSGALDPHFNSNNFQIFGLDFMIDADFNLWLIEVNTNPCLEISCPLLGTIIPKMVENALELTLDQIFPPPIRYCPKGVHYFKKLQEENRFDLVYDSRVDGIYRESSTALDARLLNEEDDIYQDEGEQWNEED